MRVLFRAYSLVDSRSDATLETAVMNLDCSERVYMLSTTLLIRSWLAPTTAQQDVCASWAHLEVFGAPSQALDVFLSRAFCHGCSGSLWAPLGLPASFPSFPSLPSLSLPSLPLSLFLLSLSPFLPRSLAFSFPSPLSLLRSLSPSFPLSSPLLLSPLLFPSPPLSSPLLSSPLPSSPLSSPLL